MTTPVAGQTFTVTAADPAITLRIYNKAYNKLYDISKQMRVHVGRVIQEAVADKTCCTFKYNVTRDTTRILAGFDDRGYAQVSVRLPIPVFQYLKSVADRNHLSTTKVIIKLASKRWHIPTSEFTMPKEMMKPMGRPRIYCPHCNKALHMPVVTEAQHAERERQEMEELVKMLEAD